MWENIEVDRHYVGTFKIEDNEISGELIYNKKNGFLLLNLNIEVEEFFGKSYRDIKYITGKLNTGATLTLFNNRCTKSHIQAFQYQTIKFRPEYIVWSYDTSINKLYNSFCCVIENALNWSCLTKLVNKDFPSISIEDGEAVTFNWFNAKIKFSTTLINECWDAPRKEICKVVERLKIEIEVEEKKDIDFFINIRNKLLSLISFAIKDNVNIDKQYLINFDEYRIYRNDIKDYRKFEIFTSEPYYLLGYSTIHEYNFTLKQLQQNDDTLSEKLEKLSPVFNLYLSLFKYEDMPIENIFLNIVQALETFHSRFFYDNSKETYIKSVENRFKNHKDYEHIKLLLLNQTQMDKNCNYIILVSRLNDMFIGEYDGLFYDFYGNGIDYAQVIADTRHYYTHYGKSKEEKALKGNDLIEAIYVLRLLLEYHICLILGINNRGTIALSLKNIVIERKFRAEQKF